MSLMPHPAPRIRKPVPRDPKFVNALDVLNTFASSAPMLAVPFDQWAHNLRIEYPDNKSGPFRIVKDVARHREVYLFASRKTGRTVGCESYNEFMMAYLLEVNPFVASYLEQPFQVRWKDESGIHHKHIPDFLVNFVNGSCLITEVKPDEALNDPEIISRTRLLCRLLPAHASMHYVLVSRSQLKGIPFENAKKIFKFAHVNIDQFEMETLRQAFANQSQRNLDHFIQEPKPYGIQGIEGKIMSLIRSGKITFDMQQTFTHQSLLTWI